MLDRSISPTSYKIKQAKSILPEEIFVKKIPIYSVSMDVQDIVQLEFYFDSGSWQEQKTGESYFAANMLLEGSKNKNYLQIADYIDLYGASLDVKVGIDSVVIFVCCMSNFLGKILELLEDIFFNLEMSEERLTHLKKLKSEKLKLEESDVSKISKKKLREIVFSSKHPYGKNISQEDIEKINLNSLEEYSKNLFRNPKVFFSGFITQQNLNLVVNFLEKISEKFFIDQEINFELPVLFPQKKEIQIRQNSFQSSISIGKLIMKKNETEFIDLLILSSILGGYFGSRLMKNIREKNGYTYGIFSRIVTLRHASYLQIAVEVANEYVTPTMREIEFEIKKLQTEEISKEELKNVKNYFFGLLNSNMDNPIAVMEKFKNVNLYGLSLDYYDALYDAIYNISQEKAMEIAKTYFDFSTMSSVVVN